MADYRRTWEDYLEGNKTFEQVSEVLGKVIGVRYKEGCGLTVDINEGNGTRRISLTHDYSGKGGRRLKQGVEKLCLITWGNRGRVEAHMTNSSGQVASTKHHQTYFRNLRGG